MLKQTCTLLAGIMLAASIHAGDLTVDNLVVLEDANVYGSVTLHAPSGGIPMGIFTNKPIVTVLATGGTITTNAGYIIHTFTNVGASEFVVYADALNCDVLVVAGGGGGGLNYYAGGGGAGGYICTNLTLYAGGVSVFVGAGAPRTTSDGNGSNGSNSVFSSFTAIGGGGGAGNLEVAFTGGSGGGACSEYYGAVSNGATGTPDQGYKGGDSWGIGGGGGGAGGEGGHGGVGVNITGDAGNGGVGVLCDISGAALYYAGGGGGSSEMGHAGVGGSDVGGHGGSGDNYNESVTDGMDTRGGGGGGGYSSYAGPPNRNFGGAGGSGIVIVRYAAP